MLAPHKYTYKYTYLLTYVLNTTAAYLRCAIEHPSDPSAS